MKDRSTMGPIEYVFESVFWCLISMTWYKNILFRCIPNVTYVASKTALWILLFASITACAVCVFRIKRKSEKFKCFYTCNEICPNGEI